MKWLIPAKTFLIGEYLALHGGPAIVLNTSPCFEVFLTKTPGLHDIHPQSPGGKWWLKQAYFTQGLGWHDPYSGLGGLGASSAQFLGAYLASQYVKPSPEQISTSTSDLIDAYLQMAWCGMGHKPSGYDVLSQQLQGCALIHAEQDQYKTTAWPFPDTAFVLLRTGVKLATHEHLNQLDLKDNLNELMATSTQACHAFEEKNSQRLIDSINVYHEQLKQRNWVSSHTLKCIELLQAKFKPLAIKGCGALGADVILMLVATEDLDLSKQKLTADGWNVLATSRDIYQNAGTI